MRQSYANQCESMRIKSESKANLITLITARNTSNYQHYVKIAQILNEIRTESLTRTSPGPTKIQTLSGIVAAYEWYT